MKPYQSIFAHVPYQFCGHVPEYLIANTEHLCLFVFETRFGKKKHKVEWYENGVKTGERELSTSHNVFLYYLLWFWHAYVWLYRFAAKAPGRTIVLCGHPDNMFGMSLHRLVHRVRYSYWIGDFFPSRSLVIRCFERVKRFYNDHADFVWYLSDAINRIENGKVLQEPRKMTVPWGIRIYPGCDTVRRDTRRLLFVGLLRNGQGIDTIIDFIADNPQYSLSIIGEAANGYDRTVAKAIAERSVGDRVFFPNRFYSQDELIEEAKRSFAGIALYDTATDNLTHYADPGKVKALIEMGLPVIMTRISDVVRWIERFNAGIVVDSVSDVPAAARTIAENPEKFNRGVLDFSAHFDYERHYRRSFAAMEEIHV